MEQQSSDNPAQNCIFCQIAQGKIQSKKIYEDEKVVSFLDINPANPGHLLLVPKTHYSLMMQMPKEEVTHIFSVAQGLSNALLKSLDVEGTTIFTANGGVAGQKAPHFMIHVIPRQQNDGLNFIPPQKEADAGALEKFREKLVPLVKQYLGGEKQGTKQTEGTEQNDVSLDEVSKMFK
ncbi:MAG: HIT family protein [Candidatus Nanoarchaeia archaeon]